jgi:hypothetical protein
MTATTVNRLPRRPALVAGLGLLVMAVLAAFANLVGVEGLVTDGDAATTARDILGSTGLFRLSILAFVVVAVLDVVVAWALFDVFRSVDEGVARLAAWLRTAYAAAFVVAIAQLAGALRVLENGDGTALGRSDRQDLALTRIGDFHDLWSAALILFGVHLVLIGWLAWRSGWMPRLIAGLLTLAGVGYLVDSVAALLVADYSWSVSAVTFVGEVVLLVWLLVKGARLGR